MGSQLAIRSKALEALAEAASNRKLRPARDLDKLVPLIRAAPSRIRHGAGEAGDPAGGALEAGGRGRRA